MSVESDRTPGAGVGVGGEAAAERARRLIDDDAAAPAIGEDERLAVAWALKDLCYAAWSSAPQRAGLAAAALRRLADDTGPQPAAPSTRAAIAALADWTAGIACLTRGAMGEAAACFDRAGDAFHALGDTRHAAQTQVPKIMALSMLGQHAAAARCAERTQQAFLALGDTGAAGKASLNLGSIHLRQDDFPQAVQHYREAAVLFARVGDREHSVMADIGVADSLTALGDFDEATRIFARARMRASTHGLPVLEAMVEESVALLDLARGRYRDALAGFEGSRRRYERLAMPQHLAIAEKQLADAYLELNLLPEALSLFEQALARFRALAMPDDEAWTLAQCGRVHLLQGDRAAAASTLERAAAAFATLDNGVGAAAVAHARAELALQAGDAASALALAEAAAVGFAAADLPDRHARAEVLHAHALLTAGRLDAAGALFAATLARSRELQLLPVEIRCLTGQGLAARAAGDRPGARAAFAAAVALFEEQRSTLPGDEIRSAFLTDHLRPYRELLRIALDDHASAPSPALAADVLRQLDRLRARALGERLGRAADVVDDADAVAMRARLNWLYRRVARLQDDATPSAVLAAELRRIEHELLERARRHRLAAPTTTGVAAGDDGFDLDALPSLLEDDDALVEYGVVDDELLACVVTRAGVALHRRVASWPDVVEAAQSARFQLETLRHGSAPVTRHLAILIERVQARMRRLHALVWAPLAGALAHCRRIVIVAHGPLGTLPFAALHDGEQCLMQRHELAFAPSARVALRGLRGLPARSAPADSRPLRPEVPTSEIPAVRRALVLGESSRLPHAAAEARAVGALFAGSEVFVGGEATLATLAAHSRDADVIHLACHAQFRSDNPMFSALHLADGALTVEAAESLTLTDCTVVLSACESGLAEHGDGDERVGLVRAFLVAGAARVVASLWPVDDATTADFMAHFHAALSRGVSPAASLRLAQADAMARHPHPYYWAPFALYGRW